MTLVHLVSRKKLLNIFPVQSPDVLILLVVMKQQPKVLAVDKDLHDLEFLNSFLKTLNITCICAKEGVRTLILAQMQQPNLIFLDTTLNDLSTNQVVHYLKRNPETSKIPIIGCRPAKTQQDVNSLLITGVCDYIRKPYDFGKVEAIINNFLGWDDFIDEP